MPTKSNTNVRVVAVTLLSIVMAGNSSAQLKFSIPAETPGSNFGFSVSGVRDTDGDGHDEIVVGAPGANVTGPGSGKAYLFSGASATALFEFAGDTGGDAFGWSVHGLLDVNGDGFGDIVVGAPGDNNNGMGTGNVRIYSGKSGVELRSIFGTNPLERLGSAVCGIGDVDGDGRDEWAAGAPGFNSGQGRSIIFSGLTGLPKFTLTSQLGSSFGDTLAAAGDVDQDGYPDLLVASHVMYGGFVHVISGRTGGSLIVHPFPSFSIANAGDINNDGVLDQIMSDPYPSPIHPGRVWIISGATGTILKYFEGSSPLTYFGSAVSGIGDITLDGVADYAIAERGVNQLYLYSGATATIWRSIAGAGAAFPSALAGNFDFTADGVDDIIVGAPGGGGALLGYATECASTSSYGSGCSGAFGYIPSLGLTTHCPAFESFDVSASISGGLGGMPALIFIGLNPISAPLAGGCNLLIDPVFPTVISLVLGPGGPGVGGATIYGSVPTSVGSGTVRLQCAVLDPFVPQQYCMTNAVALTLP